MKTQVSEKLLRIVAPHYVAAAVWQNNGSGWRCVAAAPIIGWMVGQDAQTIANYLNNKKNKGFSYCWIASANSETTRNERKDSPWTHEDPKHI